MRACVPQAARQCNLHLCNVPMTLLLRRSSTFMIAPVILLFPLPTYSILIHIRLAERAR